MYDFPFWDPVRKGLIVQMPSKRRAKVIKVTSEEVVLKYLSRPKDIVNFHIDWFETAIVKKIIIPEYVNEPEPAEKSQGQSNK